MLVETAKANDIPYQLEVIENGGSDTAAIQMTGAGIPAGCISIPMRYIHTMSETVSINDIENTVKLICAVIECGAGL